MGRILLRTIILVLVGFAFAPLSYAQVDLSALARKSSTEATVGNVYKSFNRVTLEATYASTATNISTLPFDGPVYLVVESITGAGVTVKNATDRTASGQAVLLVSSGPFAAKQIANLTLVFGNPSNVRFSFVAAVYATLPSKVVPLTLQISKPQSLVTVGSTPLRIEGTISDPAATLTVNGAVIAQSNGKFGAQVALVEGHNSIVARAVNAKGEEATATISVSMDLTPPYMTIESPKDGGIITVPSIAVSGLVNDIVRGTVSEGQANVTVNGKTAAVANRSYLAENIPLVEGSNLITVIGADQVGNIGKATINVTYKIPVSRYIGLVSGQNQRARIQGVLAAPLQIKLLDELSNPVANKAVVFRVTQGDGIVGVGAQDEGQGVLSQTDANGVASTNFKLGTRAGNGNHRVTAKAVGFEGEVVFYASADPNPGDKLSVNSGNNQRGAANQPLPLPFVVAVTDNGSNVIQGAQVEFKVTQGTGKLQNGSTIQTATTDSDGRAHAKLTLGSEIGLDVHRVIATIVGTSFTAGFTASALQSGDPGKTSITGVVLDNQDRPLPGVTIRVDGTTREAKSNEQGQFKILEVPVGPVHLIADGSTTTVPGEWPTLPYNIVTVPGADNPLSAPIYMVKLDTQNAVYVGREDKVLTLPEVPGFKLEVKAGSVTFPNGNKEGYLSVTPVNASKIPMSPPNGMQPQFIVTIQPAGARFDPPAPLTLPNVDGHMPGAQVEMYSFDHDLEEFVSIGLGTVSADGALVKTNVGVGVIKAGWHCGSQPSGSGCCEGGGGGGGACGVCKKNESTKCDGSKCVNDDGQDPGTCKKCSGGSPVNDDTEDPGECKSCKNGNPENDPNGASCDDSKFCTSSDGKNPGPDTCQEGKCEGKTIERTKTGEEVFEADFGKVVKAIQKGFEAMSQIADTTKSGSTFTVKTQAKKLKVKECCEIDQKIVDSEGIEGNGSIEAGFEIKSPNYRIPYALGLVTVQFGGKFVGSGSVFMQQYLKACSDPDKCYEKWGGQFVAYLEGSVGLGFVHPDLLSVIGSARYQGSLNYTAECGPMQGGGCYGPISMRGQIKALSFVSYTFVYIVPGTSGCVESL